MKYNTPTHFAVFNEETTRLHRMIKNVRYYYERRLALESSYSPKPCFAYVRRRRGLRIEVENVIVNGVDINQPSEYCVVFSIYFCSAFRHDDGNDPQLKYSANCRMQHFIISAEDVHRQLINLNPNKS